MSADWQALQAELDRWQADGKTIRFWLRDDDAVAPSEALDRLISLSEAHAAPVLLAVIPRGATEALAKRLRDAPTITACTHGYAHLNHAPSTEKKQELGAHRPLEDITEELRDGASRLHDLFGMRLAPVLVPPWNRIAPDVIAQLPALGFRGLSAFGDKGASGAPEGLTLLPTHLDIMDWHGTRGGRPHGDLVAELVQRLAAKRVNGDTTVGILAHHLVHDEQAWSFLSDLLRITAAHPAARWVDIGNLLQR